MAILNSAFLTRLKETSPSAIPAQIDQVWDAFKFLRANLHIEIGPDGNVYYSPLNNLGEMQIKKMNLRRKP